LTAAGRDDDADEGAEDQCHRPKPRRRQDVDLVLDAYFLKSSAPFFKA